MADAGRRPGGRSSRVREAVHAATVRHLAGPDWASATLAAVARDAGVQPSSVYRRWGSFESLLADVVETLLAEDSPLPDTGSLADDLHRWAVAMADDLGGPEGQVLVRAAVLRAGGEGAEVPGRIAQIEAMLGAASARGEAVPTVPEVFELLVAPLYGYAIFAPAGLQRAPVLARRLYDTTRGSSHG